MLLLLSALDETPAPEDTKAGWVALLLFLALAGATVLLWLSMRRHLARIQVPPRDRGPQPPDESAEGAAEDDSASG